MAGASDWNGKIKTAVITGQHPFVVEDLHGFFRSIPEIDFYPQHMEDFVTDIGSSRHFDRQTTHGHPWLNYDVIVFYNMHRTIPDPDDKLGARTIEVLEKLGEMSTGIVMMHHGVLAFKGWQPWSDMVGIQERGFSSDPEHPLSAEVVNPDHPITRDMPSWDMIDETYMMDPAGEGSDILVTTDHPNSLSTLVWTRQHKNSRVMCTPLGHSRKAYNTPQFRQIMVRGIQWVAGRI
jgi:type 1 glutamine amidotransferase